MSLLRHSDTIAAIATPMGIGSIAIIRISGTETVAILKQMTPLNEFEPNTIRLTKIIGANQVLLDSALVSFFKAPFSYTGEDVAEINSHGGYVVAKSILDRLLQLGTRLADKGEFTQRAFLNGKLDLLQAEAVIDMIEARTQKTSSVFLGQLKGHLSTAIAPLRHTLLELVGHFEVHLDYPEEVDLQTPEEYLSLLQTWMERTDKLLNSFEGGRLYREGVLVVIAGKPNVGKSSLLNTLLKENRVLVSDIPGTTRDTIEEWVQLEDIPIRLVDTAGIREMTTDRVEAMGIDKARDLIKEADWLILVLDVLEGLNDDDKSLLRSTASQNRIIVINKLDIYPNHESEMRIFLDQQGIAPNRIVSLSLKTPVGIDELRRTLAQNIQEVTFQGAQSDGPVIANIRQKEKLWQAKQAVLRSISSIEAGYPEDFWVIDLRKAIESLGEMTGENVSDEILTHIFSRFCVGK
ncbi:MAG: tRNA uridine-5-carboxymethylaminomethyl(34) synthesis GTPase MnmE [Candidatus Margulisiibacteriota bacterium]